MNWLLLLLAFAVGERLEYTGKFGILSLGTMVLQVEDTVVFQGTPCFRIVSYLSSNPDLRLLFTLNDTIEVHATTEDLLPLAYEERLHEGKHHARARIRFDRAAGRAVINDTLEKPLLPLSRDLLSFWYHLRRIPLSAGETLEVAIQTAQDNYDIPCHITEGGVLKTVLGSFETMRVSPQTSGKGIFGARGGMEIWFGKDSKRFPVQIKARMKFGTVIFRLSRVHE